MSGDINDCRVASDGRAARNDRTEAVILVHGMLSSVRSMSRIADSLSAARYRVINWSYPTMTRSLTVHASNLEHCVRDLTAEDEIRRLHFVGHSMGNIILRIALQSLRVPAGGRFVMLAPPNSGSRLTRLPIGPMVSWFPHLAELSESDDSLVNQLAEPRGLDVGVLAAQRDLVVDLDRTHLKVQKDHLVLSTTHQGLPGLPEAVNQIRHFIQRGEFERSETQAIRIAA